MPSLKDFKMKLTSKSKPKKSKTMQSKMPPAPGTSQTPPAPKRTVSTALWDGRASAPAAVGLGASTSMKSLLSSPSPTSSRLQLDEHNQLKETGRLEEREHSSDPDTSLLDYEDDMNMTTTLKRSLSMRYGSDGRLYSANSSESIDTIGMSHGLTSNSNQEVVEEVIIAQNSKPGILRGPPTIPRSESPLHSRRGSGQGTFILTSKNISLKDSLRDSMKSLAEQNTLLTESIEKVEDVLADHVDDLARLTLEKSKATSEREQLEYYQKLESSTEKTLRDQEELIKTLKDRIENLEKNLEEYEKYKRCTDEELGEMSETLKAQNKNLENLVYKLNQELSYCQTHHQLVKDPNGNRVKGLPEDAPTPAWMVNFKYLSPLVKSLEDQVSMKTQELASLKRKFAKYEADIRSITSENDNLREALKAGGSDPESIGKKTWSQLQQQALLVLEENEILLQQLDLQDDKVSQVHESHYYELTQLEDKVRKVEAERQSVLERLSDTKCQLEMCRSKCSEQSASLGLKMDRDEHNRIIIDYKAKLDQLKEDNERQKEAFLTKLCDLKSDNDKSEKAINELADDLKESKQELRRKDKTINSLEEDCAALTREVKKGRDIVANLLLVTDEAVNERQSMKHFLQSENKEKKRSVGAIVESELVKEKVVESYKRYQVKATEQIDKLIGKLEKQAGEFDVERREYERQIKHLRLMVHEKDVKAEEAFKDKRDVEECLEFVWSATQSDNHDMNNSLRKSLRESRDRELQKFFMNESKTDVLHQTG